MGKRLEPVNTHSSRKPFEDSSYFNYRSLKRLPRRKSLSTFVTNWLDQVTTHRNTVKKAIGNSYQEQDTMEHRDDTQVSQISGIEPTISQTPTKTPTKKTGPTSQSKLTKTTSEGSTIKDGQYRAVNLNSNGITLLKSDHTPPEYITKLCSKLEESRNSVELSSKALKGYLSKLERFWQGDACENDVKDALTQMFFPSIVENLLKSGQVGFLAKFVPNSDSTPIKVVTPRPDIVYGYDAQDPDTFSVAQKLSVGDWQKWADVSTVNNFYLAFPFFVVEVKAEGHVNGSLWVAVNQCLGGSATCVNVVDQLNQLLMEYPGAKRINDASFAIAMDQNVARLLVAWKGDQPNYSIQKIGSFFLDCQEHFVRLRKIIDNILDWGANERLKEIQGALDFIAEAKRKAASSAAKSRTPPEASGDADEGSKRSRHTKK